MTRDEAKREIQSQWKRFYPADSKGGIICPLCDSGSGKHGTGITQWKNAKMPYTLKCFGGSCGFTGDIFSLLEQDHKFSFNEALEFACNELGIVIDGKRTGPTAKEAFSEPNKETGPADQSEPKLPEFDYTDYYDKCRRDALASKEAMAYFTGRGFDRATVALNHLGYDAEWISPKVKENGNGKPCVIIPISSNHYIARGIDERYYANEVGGGKVHLFNESYVLEPSDQPIFVTEGAFDAIAVESLGYKAVGLNSVSNAKTFIDLAKANRSTYNSYILLLDNDKGGKTTENKIAAELKSAGILFTISHIESANIESAKDANELLVKDKAQLEHILNKAVENHERASEPDTDIFTYLSGTEFDYSIFKFKQSADRKTGFSNWDNITRLYAGLYVLGAVPSLGKTSFCLQIAENLARAGEPVLFFSLEQTRLEMATKILARNMYTSRASKKKESRLTSIEIRRGAYSRTDALEVEQMRKELSELRNLHIIECEFDTTLESILAQIELFIRRTKKKPVVFIDYLQIINTAEPYSTDKQKMDIIVKKIKQTQKEQELVFFLISSLNRQNYLSLLDFTAFKESGGIEYTADVILGLQLQVMHNDIFNRDTKINEKREIISKAKKSNPRAIELVCLKNRYGIANYTCGFHYMPDVDFFEVAEKCELEADANKIVDEVKAEAPGSQQKESGPARNPFDNEKVSSAPTL